MATGIGGNEMKEWATKAVRAHSQNSAYAPRRESRRALRDRDTQSASPGAGLRPISQVARRIVLHAICPVRSAILLRSFETVGQVSPVLCHFQQEQLALHIREPFGRFQAISGVQPVAGYIFFFAHSDSPTYHYVF
jgi:hypothetical protein